MILINNGCRRCVRTGVWPGSVRSRAERAGGRRMQAGVDEGRSASRCSAAAVPADDDAVRVDAHQPVVDQGCRRTRASAKYRSKRVPWRRSSAGRDVHGTEAAAPASDPRGRPHRRVKSWRPGWPGGTRRWPTRRPAPCSLSANADSRSRACGKRKDRRNVQTTSCSCAGQRTLGGAAHRNAPRRGRARNSGGVSPISWWRQPRYVRRLGGAAPGCLDPDQAAGLRRYFRRSRPALTPALSREGSRGKRCGMRARQARRGPWETR